MPKVNLKDIEEVLPFLLLLDSELRCIAVGKKWKKISPSVAVGRRLEEGLELIRPRHIDSFDEICRNLENAFIYRLKAKEGLIVRGQFYRKESSEFGETLLFIGSPWIRSLEELKECGLELSDFPPHHFLGDLLVLLQTERTNQLELRELADKLRISAEELRHQNEELRRSSEAQRALEVQLRQSQKMEALGRLAGGVAHDFNNILFAIDGYADAALSALDDGSKAAQSIRQMKMGAARATALVQQLLAFSRQKTLKAVTIDIGAEVEQVTALIMPLMRGGIRISTDLPSESLRVWADPNALQQILMNLAINAVDAMPEGGGLRIGIGIPEHSPIPELAPVGFAEIVVSDTGTGIEPETLEKIFEPFFTTKEPGKGTGIGLSIVHSLVEQCGGTIDAASTIGEGTKFRILLPRILEKGEEPSLNQKYLQKKILRETQCILLVEDDPLVRKILVQMLTAAGYEVLENSGPREALKVLEERKDDIDLIVTDIVMPGMSGLRMVREIEKRGFIKPVLFVTGDAREASLHPASWPPHYRLLRKPFPAMTLLDEVHTLLQQFIEIYPHEYPIQ
ncbi:MAG: hybrid sensor histidine kinase/response regulator [Bdellovibrionota bacterium]